MAAMVNFEISTPQQTTDDDDARYVGAVYLPARVTLRLTTDGFSFLSLVLATTGDSIPVLPE
jgi:hypothetical protein